MTTSNEAEIMKPENEEAPERTISEIWDLPKSELTDDEIERLIEYKAEMKARDDAHEQRMSEISNALLSVIEINLNAAQQATSTLDGLIAHAIDRFTEESNG